MTRDEILKFASAAASEDFSVNRADGKNIVLYAAKTNLFLERFAALIAAHEREQCAKVCDEIGDYAETEHVNYPHWTPWGAARECALKIRLKEKA